MTAEARQLTCRVCGGTIQPGLIFHTADGDYHPGCLQVSRRAGRPRPPPDPAGRMTTMIDALVSPLADAPRGGLHFLGLITVPAAGGGSTFAEWREMFRGEDGVLRVAGQRGARRLSDEYVGGVVAAYAPCPPGSA
jgi:hypothetical protein